MEHLKKQEEIIANWTGDLSTPIVSIICPAYNHEKYILDAIEGFLNQETSFPFEVMIRDDASTDRTPEILREIENKYPKIINVIYESENQFSKGIKPFKFTAPKAKGKYLAICDADDYWTDPLKLQKQVDFLEHNENFAITHHKADILEGGKIKPDSLNTNSQNISTIDDLVTGNYIRTLSAVFRNPRSKAFFSKLPSCPIGDFTLHLLILNHFGTNIKFFPDNMGVYRIHNNGIFEARSLEEKHKMCGITYEKIIDSSLLHSNNVVQILKKNYHDIFWTLFEKEQNADKKLKYLQKSIKYSYQNIQSLQTENNKIQEDINKIRKNSVFKLYRKLKSILRSINIIS